jgi:hypothetical protein
VAMEEIEELANLLTESENTIDDRQDEIHK